MVARAARTPLVVHTAFSFPHLDDPAKAWLYRPLELTATGLSDHVFCISRLGYTQALALGRSPRYGVSNPGIGLDVSEFAALEDQKAARRALGLPEQGLLVGTAGRLTPHKRIGLFLEVARRVAAERADAQFVVVGDGPERASLDAFVASAGVTERVRFIRHLPDADMARYFRALDAFALPTEREGFGMVFAEAMACETAVIGPDMAPVNDILTPDTGVLVGRDDADAYVREILRLLEEPERRVALGRKARARILASFDERTGHTAIERTYRELLARTRGAKPA
jgi:glycosyltransferase involved in cell wall biosynthesis